MISSIGIGIRRSVFTFVFGVLVGACAGSSKQESTGEYLDDTAITTKVKTAFLVGDRMNGLAINVETFKGTVQLSGFAYSQVERARAEELARTVKGVATVKNDILIR
ncbi:MAG: BON domain-containing protein [Gammaproteobacteria bacterium]